MEEDVPDAAKLKGYHPYWCSTAGGRGGVAILSKIMPYSVEPNLGNEEMDEEGRIITAEYSKFFLVCVYVPNAGRKLVNLDRRLRWNKLFQEHVAILKEKKPVVICGDMNVAHEEIGKLVFRIFQLIIMRNSFKNQKLTHFRVFFLRLFSVT